MKKYIFILSIVSGLTIFPLGAFATGTVDFSSLQASVTLPDNPVFTPTSLDWTDLCMSTFGPDDNIVNGGSCFSSDPIGLTYFEPGGMHFIIGNDATIPGDVPPGVYHILTYNYSTHLLDPNAYCTNDVSYNTGHDYEDCLGSAQYAGQDYTITVYAASTFEFSPILATSTVDQMEQNMFNGLLVFAMSMLFPIWFFRRRI